MQLLLPIEQITAILPDNAPLTEAARLIESVQTEARAIATKHLSSLGPVPVEICLANTAEQDQLGFSVDSANKLDMEIPLSMADDIMTELKEMLESKASKAPPQQ